MSATETFQTAQLFCFSVPKLSGLQLALAMPEVLEITRLTAVTPVPFSHSSILGLALWRTEVITVVDLAAAICRTPALEALSPEHDLIVAQTAIQDRLQIIAIPCLSGSGLQDVSRLATRDVLPEALASSNHLFHAVIRSANHLTGLLNLASLGHTYAGLPA